MNTQELEELAGWDEADLRRAVVEFVRTHERLPHYDELARLRPAGSGQPFRADRLVRR